jgi:dTDP-glucose 4,6-dehydratase
MHILVTGGSGFIGANLLGQLVPRHPEHRFVNVDALTYAAHPHSLAPLAGAANYEFHQVDIADAAALAGVFEAAQPSLVIHLAAESHVDRSIHGPRAFVRTNVEGTLNVLECCRRAFGRDGHGRLHHVGTDEVYGSLGPSDPPFHETTRYDPSSRYSATKAASDHLVRAYHRTYGLDVTITSCSNNYGPLQFPEKLIPLMTLHAAEGAPLPVYGTGLNVRDWLHVHDHVEAIWRVATRAAAGRTYNVGGGAERTNLAVVEGICAAVAEHSGRDLAALRRQITFVRDRPGHDLRYAIDARAITAELGWAPTVTFEAGLRDTVRWYLDHPQWVAAVRGGATQRWFDAHAGVAAPARAA